MKVAASDRSVLTRNYYEIVVKVNVKISGE